MSIGRWNGTRLKGTTSQTHKEAIKAKPSSSLRVPGGPGEPETEIANTHSSKTSCLRLVGMLPSQRPRLEVCGYFLGHLFVCTIFSPAHTAGISCGRKKKGRWTSGPSAFSAGHIPSFWSGGARARRLRTLETREDFAGIPGWGPATKSSHKWS